MQKTINLTKKEAIRFYNSAQDQGFKDLLETNFGKDFWKQEITDLVYDLDSLKEYCKNNNISFSLPSKLLLNFKIGDCFFAFFEPTVLAAFFSFFGVASNAYN